MMRIVGVTSGNAAWLSDAAWTPYPTYPPGMIKRTNNASGS
ncbi:TPA: hypothetical protein ACYR75_002569 [Escherichia coli]